MLQEGMIKKLPSRRPPKGTRTNATKFKKGHVANPNGRPKGSQNALTKIKYQIISSTGMTPLEFLTFAYRDQLYEKYIEELASDGKTVIFRPDPKASKINVPLQLRATCALGAAPYVHKKMPVGVEIKERNSAYLSTERMRSMSTEELEQFLSFMDRFGVAVDLTSTRELPLHLGEEEEET